MYIEKRLYFGPCREKTCLRGFRQSEIQTSLLSYRDNLENYNFTSSKLTYEIFQKANNKGVDQTARRRRLVCTCVVRKPPKTGFLATRSTYFEAIFVSFLESTILGCSVLMILFGLETEMKKNGSINPYNKKKTSILSYTVFCLLHICKYVAWQARRKQLQIGGHT